MITISTMAFRYTEKIRKKVRKKSRSSKTSVKKNSVSNNGSHDHQNLTATTTITIRKLK